MSDLTPDAGGTAGNLVLSGGGITMVATDTLFAQLHIMRRVQGQAGDWRVRLAHIRDLETSPAPLWAHGTVGASVLNAAASVDAIEARCGDLADALGSAAESYGQAERGQINLQRSLGELAGWQLGALIGFLPPVQWAMYGAAVAVGGLTLVEALHTRVAGPPEFRVAARGEETAPTSSALQVDPRLFTSTAFVGALRVVMSSLDDVQAGMLRIPFPVSQFAGEGGLGIEGVQSMARGVLGGGRAVSVFRRSPVTVKRVGEAVPVLPPRTLESVATRIPNARAHRPQVRIEKYGDLRHPSWGVYVAGTVEWNPRASSEPWDISSNIAAVAGEQPASEMAVRHAMRAAGIAPGDPVVLAGHSQGGAVVQRIAAEGEFNTRAVVTFGAPEGNLPVPAGVSEVAVEHTNDLVPALTGVGGVGGAESTGDRLIVRREAFHDQPIPTNDPLPAHNMSTYAHTARAMDGSTETRLTDFARLVTTTLGAGAGSATLWKGERLVPSSVGPAR
ncbi:hypothetical protein [Cryobacterium sp. CG_9.6]|uniref:hypothetical protein n=1 Tax=Cryobacterium sp. CG_9.6 TaxID=2760710 RepID=UPI002474FA92|nr:hypothetical protein [Cryobacterium sp. CG_9.6]MDH6235412.1 hypothetical protein [Cryobacterium sp. CG_9.6]